ncbi:MAG TPA: hypothetical protein VF440_03085 [Novosphingobium sp.]
MKSELPASRAHFHPPLAATAGRQSVPRAANDNHHGFTEDALLRAALRHFAEHGLGAAEQARRNAERAFFAGDRADYDWWLAICRTLDRRMAAAVAARAART